eukprot:Pgem_evm7s14806
MCPSIMSTNLMNNGRTKDYNIAEILASMPTTDFVFNFTTFFRLFTETETYFPIIGDTPVYADDTLNSLHEELRNDIFDFVYSELIKDGLIEELTKHNQSSQSRSIYVKSSDFQRIISKYFPLDLGKEIIKNNMITRSGNTDDLNAQVRAVAKLFPMNIESYFNDRLPLYFLKFA